MQYQSEPTDNEVQNTLPPMITNNVREKLLAEQVSIECLKTPKEKHDQRKKLVYTQPPTSHLQSNYSLNVVCYPKVLNYEVGDITTVHSLRVWNASMRSLYVTCNGILNDSEDNGAFWFWHPPTRSLLAPGLATTFFIKAIPKNVAPASSLRLALQLAGAYKRDSLMRKHAVDIKVPIRSLGQEQQANILHTITETLVKVS